MGGLPAHSALRSDHLNAVALGKSTIQTVAVVGFVADRSRGEGVEEAQPEDPTTSWLFVRRSAFNTNSERKTVIIGESKDFRHLAAFGRPDREAPFCPREGGADECLLQVEFSSHL